MLLSLSSDAFIHTLSFLSILEILSFTGVCTGVKALLDENASVVLKSIIISFRVGDPFQDSSNSQPHVEVQRKNHVYLNIRASRGLDKIQLFEKHRAAASCMSKFKQREIRFVTRSVYKLISHSFMFSDPVIGPQVRNATRLDIQCVSPNCVRVDPSWTWATETLIIGPPQLYGINPQSFPSLNKVSLQVGYGFYTLAEQWANDDFMGKVVALTRYKPTIHIDLSRFRFIGLEEFYDSAYTTDLGRSYQVQQMALPPLRKLVVGDASVNDILDRFDLKNTAESLKELHLGKQFLGRQDFEGSLENTIEVVGLFLNLEVLTLTVDVKPDDELLSRDEMSDLCAQSRTHRGLTETHNFFGWVMGSREFKLRLRSETNCHDYCLNVVKPSFEQCLMEHVVVHLK